MDKHRTASATQVGEILREAIKAITSVIDNFSASDLINCLKGNGEKLAGYMGLVFTALMTNQVIIVQAPQFRTWRTVKLGEYPTRESLKSALTDAGHKISDWAKDILGKPAFKISPDLTDLELVRVSVGELGFKSGAKLKDIYDRAWEWGLMLCPPEVGPQLRLQYKDQPKGEWLLIAMEPISASAGDLDVFRVRRHDGGASWLSAFYGNPDFVWDAGRVWVFARRK